MKKGKARYREVPSGDQVLYIEPEGMSDAGERDGGARRRVEGSDMYTLSLVVMASIVVVAVARRIGLRRRRRRWKIEARRKKT